MKILISDRLDSAYINFSTLVKLIDMNSSALEKHSTEEYYKDAGISYEEDKQDSYQDPEFSNHVWLSYIEAIQKTSELEFLYILEWWEKRTHPDLIRVMEENPQYGFKIIEIPDDVDWEIDSRGAGEIIREKSRSWS